MHQKPSSETWKTKKQVKKYSHNETLPLNSWENSKKKKNAEDKDLSQVV